MIVGRTHAVHAGNFHKELWRTIRAQRTIAMAEPRRTQLIHVYKLGTIIIDIDIIIIIIIIIISMTVIISIISVINSNDNNSCHQ